MISLLNLQPKTAILAPSPSQPETTSNHPLYVGLYDYNSQTDNEISFKKNDLMYIISIDEGDSWYARIMDSGREGYIPRSYVTEYENILQSEK